MSYGIGLSIEHYVDDDGITQARIASSSISGLPPEGGYSLNGHLYTGPGESGDSINVSTPHGYVNHSAMAPTYTEVARESMRVKNAANAAVYAEQARREREQPVAAPDEADVVDIVDEA